MITLWKSWKPIRTEYNGNMDPGHEDVMWLLLCGNVAFSPHEVIAVLQRKKHGLPEKQLLKFCVGQILPCRPQKTNHNQQYSKWSTGFGLWQLSRSKVEQGWHSKGVPVPFLSKYVLRTEGVEGKSEKVILAIPGAVNLGAWITNNKYIYSAWDSSNFGTV